MPNLLKIFKIDGNEYHTLRCLNSDENSNHLWNTAGGH
jgi:hypothetical protein